MKEEFSYPCASDHASVRVLRATIRDQLEAWNIDAGAANRIVLVVDEIASNSIDHSAEYRVQPPHFRLGLVETDVEFTFVDPDMPESLVVELARRFAELTAPPALDDERGRGLFLIRQSLEDVRFVWTQSVGLTLSGRLTGVAS